MSTLRIRGIPGEATIDDISQLYKDNAGVSLARTSTDLQETTQTATISFPSSKDAKKTLGQWSKFKIQGKQVSVDDNFFGLTVLSAGTDPVVE